MKKLVLLLFLILAVMQTATAQTLEGKITYTVDSARKITFDGVKKQIPVSLFSSYLIDPDYKSSMDYIKYELSPTDRDIEVFKKGKFKIGYAVTYNNNKDITYYFTKFKGLLIAIDIYESTKNQKTIPQKMLQI